MNKKFFRSVLFLIAVLFGSSVFLYADLTAKLELRAEVDTQMEISVSAEPAAQNLPVGSGAAEGLLIGTVTERSNSTTGYTVTVVSDNQSKLINQDSSYFILYTITYGTIEVDLSSGSAVVVNTNSMQDTGETTREIRISFSADDIPADIYTDTLTFVMAAK